MIIGKHRVSQGGIGLGVRMYRNKHDVSFHIDLFTTLITLTFRRKTR